MPRSHYSLALGYLECDDKKTRNEKELWPIPLLGVVGQFDGFATIEDDVRHV